MKLLVFAHTPPPHHGQSYMVKLMLDGFGGDRRKAGREPNRSPYGIECYHVNAQVSKRMENIGEFRPSKLLLLFWYCLEAIWCRFRYGLSTLYYVPAPGKFSALLRDWMVLTLCRLFFKQIILHWHAAGLGKWLETETQQTTRRLTFSAMGGVDLSIILSDFNRQDAEKEYPKRIQIVNNGIPDPCPQFESDPLPRRLARAAARRKLLARAALSPEERTAAGGDPEVFRVLYLAHCIREKGLFDSVEGALAAQKKLSEAASPIRVKLLVAGQFMEESERAEFERRLAEPLARETVEYCGFLGGAAKEAALRQADLLCFPTTYRNENQPVNLIEAFAYGLPVITTRWRSVPELLPKGYPGIVDPGDIPALAAALLGFIPREDFVTMRSLFRTRYGLDCYLESLAQAIKSVEASSSVDAPAGAVGASASI